MRPVPVCHTVTFFFVYAVPSFVGEAYMPPGRGVRRAGFPVRCLFPVLCRAGLRPQARFGAQPGRKARLLARRS